MRLILETGGSFTSPTKRTGHMVISHHLAVACVIYQPSQGKLCYYWTGTWQVKVSEPFAVWDLYLSQGQWSWGHWTALYAKE